MIKFVSLDLKIIEFISNKEKIQLLNVSSY